MVVLSHAAWSGRFGADPDVLGRTLILDGEAHAVVGVLPSDFVLPNFEFDLVLPLALEADPRRSARGTNFLRVIARLRAGVSAEERPGGDGGPDRAAAGAVPAGERQTHISAGPCGCETSCPGLTAPGSCSCPAPSPSFSLMVCFNLGVLHAVRADGRRGERAVQAALGASRTRLVRQSLLESGVLVLAGAALGTVLAAALSRGLRSLVAVTLPFVGDASPDIRVAAFGVASALAAFLVSGVLPAVRTRRLDPLAQLRFAGGRMAPRRATLADGSSWLARWRSRSCC